MLATIRIPKLELSANINIWHYITSVKFVSILSILLFISSIILAYQKHISRQFNVQYQKAMQNNHELQVEWRQLLVEKGMVNSSSRVQYLAFTKLKMRTPLIHEIRVI